MKRDRVAKKTQLQTLGSGGPEKHNLGVLLRSSLVSRNLWLL